LSWDDTKVVKDKIKSADWNAMVTDQQSRAVDSEVVKLSGAQDINGDKTFKDNVIVEKELNANSYELVGLTSSLGIPYKTAEWDNTVTDPALTVNGDLTNYIKKVRLVTLNDDGIVTSVLADYNNPTIDGTTDGTDGQVMVEFPKLYFKEIFDGNDLISVEVSDFALPGFELHPAFSWGNGRDKIYIGAYEASYSGSNVMQSISGQAVKTSQILAQFRTAAVARGGEVQADSSWHTMGFWQQHLIDLLFYAYYETRHSQQALPGYTEASSFDYAYTRETGRTNNLTTINGNVDVDLADVDSDLDGIVSSGNKIANRFLWIENIFGHIWKFNDGVTYVPIESVGVPDWTGEFRAVYATADPRLFSSTDADILANYNLLPVTPFAGSNEIWIGRVGSGFVPTASGTNENQYWTDYHWNRLHDSGRNYLRSVLAGGFLSFGGRAGVLSRGSSFGLVTSDSTRGSRLCYSKI